MTVNQKVKYKDWYLDTVFHALSDPTRRQLLTQLLAGPLTMTALLEPHKMSLVGLSKHLKILETANLVDSEKSGRNRTYTLKPDGLYAVKEFPNSLDTDKTK